MVFKIHEPEAAMDGKVIRISNKIGRAVGLHSTSS